VEIEVSSHCTNAIMSLFLVFFAKLRGSWKLSVNQLFASTYAIQNANLADLCTKLLTTQQTFPSFHLKQGRC